MKWNIIFFHMLIDIYIYAYVSYMQWTLVLGNYYDFNCNENVSQFLSKLDNFKFAFIHRTSIDICCEIISVVYSSYRYRLIYLFRNSAIFVEVFMYIIYLYIHTYTMWSISDISPRASVFLFRVRLWKHFPYLHPSIEMVLLTRRAMFE